MFVIFGDNGCTGKPSRPNNRLLECDLINRYHNPINDIDSIKQIHTNRLTGEGASFVLARRGLILGSSQIMSATSSLGYNHPYPYQWHNIRESLASHFWSNKLIYSVKLEEMVGNLRSWDVKLCDLELLDRPEVKLEEMVVGPRVGIDYALLEGADALWRFVVAGKLCIKCDGFLGRAEAKKEGKKWFFSNKYVNAKLSGKQKVKIAG
ncbi:unnamed protein product [Lactuca virosa]|uniref:Uncharacterized protein n=1 Tax=Lactuca virosa TaxID=75947 RepID=A0AAU9MIC0_9ASTR|nr:unnamed protein product [Lactuca virosa]